MEKKKLRLLLSDLTRSIRCKHVIEGVPAENRNQHLISQFYEAWLCLVSDVLSQSFVSDESFSARLRNFARCLVEGDVVDILTICQDAASVLINGSQVCLDGFKAHLIQKHPEASNVVLGIISPVQPLLVRFFERANDQAVVLRLVLMVFRYGKKLTLDSSRIEQEAISSYLACESKLTTDFITPNTEAIASMNRIMRVWLRNLDLKNLVPSHGGGSVAEGRLSQYQKFCALKTDTFLNVVFKDSLSSFSPLEIGNGLERISRTIFVPKTFSKLRTISMEPATLQYFQQGVMKRLYRFMGKHPYLERIIHLKDQEHNKQMAMEGSLRNTWCTIDLSAASDTVSWDLVKAVFAGTPLLKWLYVTRSKRTLLPTGELVDLKKFAPMGSALCFPVECLVFASVVEHVTQKLCSQGKCVKHIYSVFGDDIIVHPEVVSETIQCLEDLGFSVNRSKTFITGPFRESCGGDYFDGFDVSSVYYRLPNHNSRKVTPEVYAAICSSANLCAERDLPILREHLIKKILHLGPYFNNTVDKSPYLYSPSPSNYHVRCKWDRNFQNWQGRFCTVISRPVHVSVDDGDDVAYFIKLSQMAQRLGSFPDEEPVDVPLHGTHILLGRAHHEVDRN